MLNSQSIQSRGDCLVVLTTAGQRSRPFGMNAWGVEIAGLARAKTIAPQAVAAILADRMQEVYSDSAGRRKEASPFARCTGTGVNRAGSCRVLACVRCAANLGGAWGYGWFVLPG